MNSKNLFSYRNKILKFEDKIYTDSIPENAKNHIWDILCKFIFNRIIDFRSKRMNYNTNHFLIENKDYSKLIEAVWTRIFNEPLDRIPEEYNVFYQNVRLYYYSLKWNGVYNFIEFIFEYNLNNDMINSLNQVFEEDNLGYRIIDKKVTDIINKTEINSINEALKSPFSPIQKHFQTSIELLYGKNPDYRNSIKESISAVEAVAKFKLKDKSSTLSVLIPSLGIHRLFQEGLRKLYSFTSGAEGIRHALMDSETLTREDAKFFLVICSGFVNYINEKEIKLGNKK